MKTDVHQSTRTEYLVQVRKLDGSWETVHSPYVFDSYVLAYKTWQSLHEDPDPARIVEVVTSVRVAETPVWPFEWTHEPAACQRLADHSAHVIHPRRGQFCRGNGPFMADDDWTPT